jgi:hypothetical protein
LLSSGGSVVDRFFVEADAEVATIRERKPGVWEVRVFVGEDECAGRSRSAGRCGAPSGRPSSSLPS